jgi:hypothetical protein
VGEQQRDSTEDRGQRSTGQAAGHPATGPVDDDVDEPSWWLANAVEAGLQARESGKVVLYFRTAWEPPIDWAKRASRAVPGPVHVAAVRRGEEGFAGLWVSNEHAINENTLTVATVGYPTV